MVYPLAGSTIPRCSYPHFFRRPATNKHTINAEETVPRYSFNNRPAASNYTPLGDEIPKDTVSLD